MFFSVTISTKKIALVQFVLHLIKTPTPDMPPIRVFFSIAMNQDICKLPPHNIRAARGNRTLTLSMALETVHSPLQRLPLRMRQADHAAASVVAATAMNLDIKT